MSDSEYQVVDVFWKEAGMTIQVVKLPDDVVEEKLALISREDGTSKQEYDAFLISKCLLDVDMVARFVMSMSKTSEEGDRLILGIVGCILEVNPAMDPEHLVLSKHNIIRLPSMNDNTRNPRRLVDNPRWGERMDDLVDDVMDDIMHDIMGDFTNISDSDYYDAEDGTDDVEYTAETVEWEEASITLKIKKFSEADAKAVFASRKSFLSERQYKVFVIQRCIIEYWKLIAIIEREGVVFDVGPEKLTDILYNVCVGVNPFMDLEHAKNKGYTKISDDETKTRAKKPASSSKRPAAKTKSTSTKAAAAKKPAKEKKSFSSVSKKDLLSLGSRMAKRLIGQDEAINAITEAVQVAGAGLRDPAKPIGVFLLTGDTGTGKTHCAKVLAQNLIGNENDIIRIDCSEYAYGHEISKLIGSPNGYVGFENGGILTNKIQERPFSIVLFDELEKAHSKLYDILLQILDDGRLTDNKGVAADFSDAIVIMTSNIGVKDVKAIGKTVGFGDGDITTQEKRSAAISSSLRKHFKPEFLNRIDSVITFNSLDRIASYKIIDLELSVVSKYLTDRGTTMEVFDTVKDKLFEVGFSKEYGARELKRAVERLVVKPLALKILRGNIPDRAHVRVSLRDGEILFTYKNNTSVEVPEEDIFADLGTTD